jgi:predicted HTH domain antitoxin
LRKRALVLELLRQARIGQSKAAELLELTRAELLDVMVQRQVPSGLSTLEDVDQEIEVARRHSHDDSAA